MLDRRHFLERVLAAAVFSPAHQLFEGLRVPKAEGFARRFGVTGYPIKYPGQGATLSGYLAKPDCGGLYPALILTHGNGGLDDGIRETAHRTAATGLVVLAADPVSRAGGTSSFDSPEALREAIQSLPHEIALADLESAYRYLATNSSVREDSIEVAGPQNICN